MRQGISCHFLDPYSSGHKPTPALIGWSSTPSPSGWKCCLLWFDFPFSGWLWFMWQKCGYHALAATGDREYWSARREISGCGSPSSPRSAPYFESLIRLKYRMIIAWFDCCRLYRSKRTSVGRMDMTSIAVAQDLSASEISRYFQSLRCIHAQA